jgi:ribonuclease J
MVKLTFFGGVKEIGGNKIMLEDQDTKIFLDFGMSFNRHGLYFEEFLKPRTANGIGDFLVMGLIPDIEGVYREDLLTHFGRKPQEPIIDGVLLSHAHADHANYVSFLHRDIPIYCGETCLRILEAVDEQSGRKIDAEVINFKKRPLFRADYKKPPIERKFHTFRTGDKFTIGSLDIEPIHVDHSVPGAYGFIIYTSKGPIIYTGDMRMHGTHSEMTMDFTEKAIEAKPLAMITEGTRIDIGKTDESEAKVYADSKREILKNRGLSIVDFNFKDVDRFRTFYNISQEIGKQIVVSFKHACFLDKYCEDEKLDVPSCFGEGVLLLKPKRMTGTYDDNDYSDAYIRKRLSHPNVITAEDIVKAPNKYLVVLNFWYFNMLADLQPKNSLYIHSLSEPFNEEMEISAERMNNWMNYFGLRQVQCHCSGHMSSPDLKELIERIRPKTLFPIHTEKPGMFRQLSPTTKMIKEGKSYSL